MEDAFQDSGASPPSFLGARLLEPIPFVYSETFDQRTPEINLARKKTAAERKRDYRAKEKALLEEIKKSQQEQTKRYIKEAEEPEQRQLLEPILTQENAREDSELENPPWRIGVYANFGPVSDSGGGYFAHGVVKPRTYKKRIPLWAVNDSKIKELIQRSFPNWQSNPRMRDDAARWAAVIHLYFRVGYTRSQIAHEIGSTDCKISGIIRSIKRASLGLQGNGRGPRSTYGRGKHPNCRRKSKSNAAAKM